MQPTLALRADSLTVTYERRAVLQALDLQVRQGEIFALLGGNGAGKTTLLNVLLGFVQPFSGRADVLGSDVGRELQTARSQLAYVAENVALYDHLSAVENLDYLLTLAGAPRNEKDLLDSLATVGIDSTDAVRRVAVYSKGMRQRVAIGLALARGAPILLLDEPTSGLDPQGVEAFGRLLGTLRKGGRTVLMVTHDVLGAIDIADRIGVLRDGRIAEHLNDLTDREGALLKVRHCLTVAADKPQ